MDGMTEAQLRLLALLAKQAMNEPVLVEEIQKALWLVMLEASTPDRG